MKLDGTYGKPGHRRQRYKCVPRSGGKPHVFTELLPREEARRDSCDLCERQVERREGPKAPRNYQFVARGIAEALHAVGGGATYMSASRVARDRARRFRVDPETGEVRESDHGQLVADWVELFAPVVFDSHRPRSWPTEGSLLLDHLPFRVRALDASGKRIPAGQVAFDVFCAVGYHAGKPRLWRAEAFSTAYPEDWSAFLGSLSGGPKRIVCDAHSGMRRAIAERWPQVELHQCEWHLQHALERLLAKETRANPSPKLQELTARAEGASRPLLLGAVHPRRARCREPEPRSLDRRQRSDDRGAVRSASPRWQRSVDMPLTTAALEQITRPITTALYPRRYALKNRDRLNRLLMLLQLQINGEDDVQVYAKTIRTWLQANGGRPVDQRRAIADPAGLPSLR